LLREGSRSRNFMSANSKYVKPFLHDFYFLRPDRRISKPRTTACDQYPLHHREPNNNKQWNLTHKSNGNYQDGEDPAPKERTEERCPVYKVCTLRHRFTAASLFVSLPQPTVADRAGRCGRSNNGIGNERCRCCP